MKRFEMLTLTLLSLFALCAAEHRISIRYEPRHRDDPFNTLIWYNKSTFDYWIKQIDTFLKPYSLPSSNRVGCDYENPPENGKVCKFKTETWSPCDASNQYGYRTGTPCIFIELKKSFEWKPKFYNSTKHLPKDMPQVLKEKLKEIEATGSKKEWENVWVSCDGENPGDREAIGPLRYIPLQGYPSYMFPYTGQKGYLNPLVAVQLQKPYHGMVISIMCRAWAANIKYDPILRTGVTRFQLLIDI